MTRGIFYFQTVVLLLCSSFRLVGLKDLRMIGLGQKIIISSRELICRIGIAELVSEKSRKYKNYHKNHDDDDNDEVLKVKI